MNLIIHKVLLKKTYMTYMFKMAKEKNLEMKLLFPIFCFLMMSCKVDESDLHNSTWKIYKKNSYDFGDVISFDDMVVKNDTIFLKNQPIYEQDEIIVSFRYIRKS